MSDPRQSPESEPEQRKRASYGRPQARRPDSIAVMTSLRPDAARAVMRLVRFHGLSRSGAVHHLVRLGAGLPPLNPLD